MEQARRQANVIEQKQRNTNEKQRSESKNTRGKGNSIRAACTGYINTRSPAPFYTPSEMILPMLNTLFLPDTATPRPGSCSNGARESCAMYPPFAEADGSAGDGGDEDEPALPTPPDPCLSGARCIISCCPCACPAPLGHPEPAEDPAPLEYGGPPDPE